MNFGFSESQQTIKDTARRFLADYCPMPRVRELLESPTGQAPTLWKSMAAQGWMGILCPEEFGGLGMGLVELAAILEEMGRSLLPGPFFSTVVLAMPVLQHTGSDTQKHEHLRRMCEGEAIATLALLEASASWELEAVNLPATGSGNNFTLTGSKLFVSDAAVADLLVVAARLHGELALFLVQRSAPGVSVRHTPSLDESRRLFAIDFRETPAELLAQGKMAHQALAAGLDIAAVSLAAEMTGGMQRLLEMTVEYAKTRKQFGKPIGQFQAVQHMCADMLFFTESSRAAAYYAAWALNENDAGASAAVATAKAYSSDAGREVGNRAVQVHGGMGFTWENDVHLFYRRAKASEIAFGDAIFHRERLAKLLLDQPAAHPHQAVA